MWRRKYLMAGRKFDLKNRKIVIVLVFVVPRRLSENFHNTDADSWQFRAKKWIKYRNINGVSRDRFEKLFFDLQDEKIDSMNVTAPICTRVT